MTPLSTRILAAALLLGMSSAGVAHADLTTGLIDNYQFDGSVQDVSGNGNHGAIVGPLASTTDRFGASNSAYLFNGVSSYVAVPNSASLSSPTTALTQAAWVYQLGVSAVGSPFNPILMKSASTENALMYRLYCGPSVLGVEYGNWTNGRDTPVTLPLNTWHHVASTYDGQRIRQYVNGVQVDSAAFTYSMVADTRPLRIGADTPVLFEVFNGKLDDVRIYGRALSGAEVAELSSARLAIEPAGGVTAFALDASRPNPTRGACALRLTLGRESDVDVELFDVAGRLTRTLLRGRFEPGEHVVTWDGRDERGEPASSGLYLVRARAGGDVQWGRVVRVH